MNSKIIIIALVLLFCSVSTSFADPQIFDRYFSPSLTLGVGPSLSGDNGWKGVGDIKAGLYIDGIVANWHPTVGFQKRFYEDSPNLFTAGVGIHRYEYVTFELRSDLVLGSVDNELKPGVRVGASIGFMFMLSLEVAYQYHQNNELQIIFSTDIPAMISGWMG